MMTITSTAPGVVIAEIVDRVLPLLEEYPRSHVILAAFTLAVLCQTTELTTDQLREVILAGSKAVADKLEEIDLVSFTDLPPEKVN